MNIEQVWKNSLNILQKQVTSVSFDLWINTLEPIDFKDGVLYLSTTSASAKSRVIDLHSNHIKTALLEVTDEITDFKVLDPFESENYQKEKIAEPIQNTVENVLYKFNPKFTFENFVVGNSNKYVYAAAIGVAEHPNKINPLFIYGGSGLGKTHLLNAIGNYYSEHFPNMKVLYVTCEKFTNDYIESLKSGKSDYNSNFREKYRNLDVLMVDDIQFISNHFGTQEEFFHTFNDLHDNNKQIIIASDRPPKEIPTLKERLVSRFSMGLIQDVQSPDLETKLAILQKKAQDEKYNVSDVALNFIAENCDANIREMEGLLSKVHFYATLHLKEEATIEDVKESLKDHISTSKQNVTTDNIIDCVCKYFAVEKNDLLGKKKNKEIVEPRQICMYVIYELLALPLTSIGQVFGGKDHTTIIYAKNKVADLMKENNRIKVAVNDIINMAKRV